jgi:DNA-binding transcriptional ArsR family regulator
MMRTPSSSAVMNASAGAVVPAESAFPMPAWEPPTLVEAGLPGSNGEQVRLSLRLVVQLSWVGPPGEDGDARKESTQEGLSQALSVTQGAVSKVLRRLVAAEIVCRERRHVRGVDRRVRVYFLSRQGETLAREIRDRFGIPPRVPENL